GSADALEQPDVVDAVIGAVAHDGGGRRRRDHDHGAVDRFGDRRHVRPARVTGHGSCGRVDGDHLVAVVAQLDVDGVGEALRVVGHADDGDAAQVEELLDVVQVDGHANHLLGV